MKKVIDRKAGTTSARIINCNLMPFIPAKAWAVLPASQQLRRRTSGLLVWRDANISLYRPIRQVNNLNAKTWHELCMELGKKTVCSAQVLDWLLTPCNQVMIPNRWKEHVIHFFGTIYFYGSESHRHVRCLYWDGCSWRWEMRTLQRNVCWSDALAVQI